jgi:hypothetical protein
MSNPTATETRRLHGYGDRVQPGEAMIRGACPACKDPATIWLWIENSVQTFDDHPRRLTVAGVITDVVHDAMQPNCGGVA